MNELAHGPVSLFALFNFPAWEIVVKSTIVIALAALACRFLHRQSAAQRHRIWVCGLAASLVVPMVCLLSPQFRLPLLPSSMDAARSMTDAEIQAASSDQYRGIVVACFGWRHITTDRVSPVPLSWTRNQSTRYPQMRLDRSKVGRTPVGVHWVSWA